VAGYKATGQVQAKGAKSLSSWRGGHFKYSKLYRTGFQDDPGRWFRQYRDFPGGTPLFLEEHFSEQKCEMNHRQTRIEQAAEGSFRTGSASSKRVHRPELREVQEFCDRRADAFTERTFCGLAKGVVPSFPFADEQHAEIFMKRLVASGCIPQKEERQTLVAVEEGHIKPKARNPYDFSD